MALAVLGDGLLRPLNFVLHINDLIDDTGREAMFGSYWLTGCR